MQLTINGEITSLVGIETVGDLIKHLDLNDRIAVEINREIIPRSQFNTHSLHENDVIEIVRAIGGG